MDLKRDALVADRFRLEQELGRGGMGVVWAARHEITGRRVALKFVQQPAHTREVVRKRFVLEARAATVLEHPHAVEVIDVLSVDDATLAMVMEWLDGETLGERLRREETLSLEDAATLLLPVISAVGTAHAMGIVHRDLKPENIFITKADLVKVLDFGLAKLAREEDGVTQTGAMVGTPAYMPPEQGMPEAVLDHRADVWALGSILFEVLTGGRPVDGKTVAQVVQRLLEDGIPPLEAVAPDVPADVAQLVDAMLVRDVDDRLPDLRRALDVLSAHSDIEVPTFGAPNTVKAELAIPSLAPASAERTPDEATLTTPGPTAIPARVAKSSQKVWLVAAGLGLAAVGFWAGTDDAPNLAVAPAVAPSTPPAPTSTAAATTAPTPSVAPIDTSTATAGSTATSVVSAAASTATAKAVRPTAVAPDSVPARAPTTEKTTAPPPKPPPVPASASTQVPPAPDPGGLRYDPPF